jgi:hypothetical protein
MGFFEFLHSDFVLRNSLGYPKKVEYWADYLSFSDLTITG